MNKILTALAAGILLAAGAIAEPTIIWGDGSGVGYNTYGNVKSAKEEIDGKKVIAVQFGAVNAQKAGALQFFQTPSNVKDPKADALVIYYRGDGGTGSFVVSIGDGKESWSWNARCWLPAAQVGCFDTRFQKKILYLKDFRYYGKTKPEPRPDVTKIRNIQLAIGAQLTSPEKQYAKFYVNKITYETNPKAENVQVKDVKKKVTEVRKFVPSGKIVEVPEGAYHLPSWVNWDLKKHYQLNTSARSSISLNNYWQFRPVYESAVERVVKERKGKLPPMPDTVPQDGFDTYIRVPGRYDCANVDAYDASRKIKKQSGNYLLHEYVQGFSRRSFFVPAEWKGKTLLLQMNGIGEQARVFVNGMNCGSFAKAGIADITPALLYGKSNQIAIFTQYPSMPVGLKHPRHKEFMNPGMGAKWWLNWHEGMGLTEDVILHVIPKNITMNDLRILPEVSKGTVAADAEITNTTKKSVLLTLSGKITDQTGKTVLTLPEEKIRISPGATLRKGVRSSWKNAQCWTPDDPVLYNFTLTLKDDQGKIADELADRFGYRELTVDKGDFRLNGTKIRLKFKSSQHRFGALEEKELRAMLLELKKMHFNGIMLEAMSERAVKLCDELGMMIAIRHIMPPLVRGGVYLPGVPNQGYPFEAFLTPRYAEARAELEKTITGIVTKFRNSPSIIIWMLNPLLCYNSEWINPNMIDAETPENDLMRATGMEENFIRSIDPTRLVIQSMSSNTGCVITANPYPTMDNQPDEWAEWPRLWAKNRKKPLIMEEIGLGFFTNYATWFIESKKRYSGWYDNLPLYSENAARYFGDSAYESAEKEDPSETGFFNGSSRNVTRPDGTTGFEMNPEVERSVVYWMERCFMNWRIFDVSGVWPFESIMSYFNGSFTRKQKLPEPKDITAPGRKAGYAQIEVYKYKNRMYDATFKGQQPFLAFLGGRKENFTSLEHAYFAGETMDKQMLFSSDLLKKTDVKAEWKLANARGKTIASGSWKGILQPGEVAKIPFSCTAPEVSSRTDYTLSFKAQAGKELCTDVLKIQVYPREKKPVFRKTVLLYDKSGSTKALLEKLKIPFTEKWDRITQDSIVIAGRNSLSPGFTTKAEKAGLTAALERGAVLLVMEQTKETLFKDYLEERRARHMFVRDAKHPVMKGITNDELHHWRGTSDLLEVYPKTENCSQNNHFMHWGSEGSIATMVMDKPFAGRFTVLVDGDAGLSRAGLLEYRIGKGLILFNQLDLANRYGVDPAATKITNQLFRYLESPERPELLTASVSGNADSYKALEFVFEPFDAKKTKVLVLDDAAKIAVKEFSDFVQNGGTALIVTKNGSAAKKYAGDLAPAFGKRKVRLYVWPKDSDLVRGLGNADFYLNPKTERFVMTKFPANASVRSEILSVVPHGRGKIVFLALDEASLKEGAAKARAKRILSTVLYRLGVPAASKPNFSGRIMDITLDNVRVPFRIDPQSKGMANGWNKKEFNDSAWQKIAVGPHWEGQGIRMKNPYFKSPAALPYDGDAWYRIHVKIPADWKGRKLYFDAQMIDDYDHVYFNGTLIGKTGRETENFWCFHRVYPIPADKIVYGGDNVIAVQVTDIQGNGGIMGKTRVGGKTEIPRRIFFERSTRFMRDFDPNRWRQW